MRGRVADATTDSAVAGAAIVVANTQLRTTSTPRGSYRIVGLAAGEYTLRVVAIGYEGLERRLALGAGDTLEVDFALKPLAIELPGIVVTAGGAAERAGESVASIAVLTQSEINHRNVITIDQALPFVPGLVENNGDFDIRGASGTAGGVGSRVLMLLDGHPVLSADGGEVDFDALPLLDLDRVEVVKGAYSALYGSAALGGVVNLITSPVGHRPASVIKLHGGLYDVPAEYKFTDDRLTYQGVDLQHSRRIGGVGARLAFAHETSDGYHQNGEHTRWFLRGKLGGSEASTHPWDAYAIWTYNDEGEYFVWRSAQRPYEVDPAALGDHELSGKLLLGATLHPVATRTFLLRLTPHFSHNWVRNRFHDNRDFHRATRTGTTATGLISVGAGHTLTLGLDASRTWVTSNFLGTPRITDLAPFVQDELELGDRVKLSAGTRLDYHQATGGEAQTTLSPKLGVAWEPVPRWSVRVSAGRGYRAPSAIEQFVSATKSGFRVIPNPSLSGETALSVEAGASGQVGGRLYLDAALFQTDFHDLISPAPVPDSLLVFQFRNVTRARVRGADLSARAALLGKRLHLGLNYLFLDSRDLTLDTPLPYRSRHNVTASLDALGGLVGVDIRHRTRVDTVLAYPADPRSDITVVDLRLAYRLLGTTVMAKVSNLLQAKYVDVRERTQGAPRSFLLTVLRGW